MKAVVVQKRPEDRDYIDIDAIIQQGSISLPAALAAGRQLYGTAFNPVLTFKSLSYFGDGNLPALTGEVRDRLVAAVGAVDLNHLPDVGRPD